MGMSDIQKDTNSLTMQGCSIYFGWGIGGSKFDFRPKGKWIWFTIFDMNLAKKVTSILRLGKGNCLLGLQDLEAKKIIY